MPKTKKPFQKLKLKPSSPATPIIIMIILSTICVFGLYKEFRPEPNPAPSTSKPTDQNISKVGSPTAFFYTKVLLDRHFTFITFPFKFEGSPLTMYLQLSVQNDKPAIERLIMQPILHQLKWPHITENDLTLFQRVEKYKSIADFMKNPPSSSQILIDRPVINITNGRFKNATILDEKTVSISDTTNYILTSYRVPLEKNGWFYYETTLDASSAQPDNENQLVWLLSVPQASENHPYYLGEIHVDFRQK